MVPSIARQSVIIKCNLQRSVLLGNYEFYYLGGLIKKCFGLDINGDMQPEEMYARITENLKKFRAQNEQEEYLIRLVSVYRPLPEYDEQMKQLFQWGANERDMWQVQTSYMA